MLKPPNSPCALPPCVWLQRTGGLRAIEVKGSALIRLGLGARPFGCAGILT